jgi:hypothetical protein
MRKPDQEMGSLAHVIGGECRGETVYVPRALTAKKQISVSLPNHIWSQLKVLAGHANRSVGDLCAEWITQRANELAAEQNRQKIA